MKTEILANKFKPWILKNVPVNFLAWQHKDIRIGNKISFAGGFVVNIHGSRPIRETDRDGRKVDICNTRGYRDCADCSINSCPLKDIPIK